MDYSGNRGSDALYTKECIDHEMGVIPDNVSGNGGTSVVYIYKDNVRDSTYIRKIFGSEN
jgi:hypothetical protein